MCTLTVVPLAEGRVRLAFNRDEQRTRPVGLPPIVRRFGPRRALLPIDPVSNGTWIAVNDAALTLAVLNLNLPSPIPANRPTRSRGDIIPSLLGCEAPADALATFEETLDYRQFAPFRLVLVGQGIVAKVTWDGREPMVDSQLLGAAPLLFTSSGLGDALVARPRYDLFQELFTDESADWADAQEQFHRSRWPNREHLSVNMSRADARTVSYSVVEIDDHRVTFTYHADAPDRMADRHSLSLPLLTAGVL